MLQCAHWINFYLKRRNTSRYLSRGFASLKYIRSVVGINTLAHDQVSGVIKSAAATLSGQQAIRKTENMWLLRLYIVKLCLSTLQFHYQASISPVIFEC